jgi:glutathione S-transferase
MKLYQNPLSPNCRKVLAVAKHVGVELELQTLDFTKGEHRAPEFLALNPNGKVPVLVDGDLHLWESNAIMAYLAGQQDTELWPKSAARYDILRWQYWQLGHWGPAIDTVTYERVLKPAMGIGEPDEGKIAQGLKDFDRYAKVLDRHLEGRSFLVGDGLTLADFAVAAPLTYAGPGQLPLGDHPNVEAYNKRLSEVPAWRDTAPKL